MDPTEDEDDDDVFDRPGPRGDHLAAMVGARRALSSKAAEVAKLSREFTTSTSVVLTEYRGLTVAQLKSLRRALGGHATYAVVKNTLTKIAAREAEVEGLDDLLSGPSAIAFVKGDPVEAARGLRDFAKANPLLVIKGGYLEGQVLSAADVSALADLIPRDQLLARLAGDMRYVLAMPARLAHLPLQRAASVVRAAASSRTD